MRECMKCGLEFPDEYLNVFWMDEKPLYPVCPICALELRNKIHGLPSNDQFSEGSYAQWQYEQAVEWLMKGKANEQQTSAIC